MDRENFYESQKFKQWWLWAITISSLLIPLGISAAGIFKQVFTAEQFGDRPMSDSGLVIFFVFSITMCAFVIWLLSSFHLETKTERGGFSYRFLPITRIWKTIQKEEIKDWKIVTKKITGYGVQHGLNSTTYNVKGKDQLELLLYSGKKLFFGTQKPVEMKAAMARLFETKTRV